MNPTLVNTKKNTVEPGWQGLYRIGGIGLVLFGLIYLTNITIGSLGIPAATDSTQYLQSLAAHPTLARVYYGLYTLGDFLLIPAVLALYLALRHLAKNMMLLAAGLMAVFIVVDIAITEANSLTLVSLTQHAASTTSTTQRDAYLAAENYALATVSLATFYSWVISSVGVLIISIAMLKGVFNKLTAYLGIVVGIVATVGGFYVFVPVLAVLSSFLVLLAFGLWCVLAGGTLYRLGNPNVAKDISPGIAA